MENPKTSFNSIDDYISAFPEGVQARLQAVRATIKAAAPDVEERISYGMPTFTLNGYLVYFAGWKSHIGVYAVSSGVREAFRSELYQYEGENGSLKFPYNKPLPLDLITRIVQAGLAENRDKASAKGRKQPV